MNPGCLTGCVAGQKMRHMHLHDLARHRPVTHPCTPYASLILPGTPREREREREHVHALEMPRTRLVVVRPACLPFWTEGRIIPLNPWQHLNSVLPTFLRGLGNLHLPLFAPCANHLSEYVTNSATGAHRSGSPYSRQVGPGSWASWHCAVDPGPPKKDGVS